MTFPSWHAVRAGRLAREGAMRNAWLALRHHMAAGEVRNDHELIERLTRRRALSDRMDDLARLTGMRGEWWS